MKIGKLDPRNLFDKGEREAAVAQQEKDTFNNIVIGKLNKKNIFESEQENRTLEKQSVRVGKLKTKVIFVFNLSIDDFLLRFRRLLLLTETTRHILPNLVLWLESLTSKRQISWRKRRSRRRNLL